MDLPPQGKSAVPYGCFSSSSSESGESVEQVDHVRFEDGSLSLDLSLYNTQSPPIPNGGSPDAMSLVQDQDLEDAEEDTEPQQKNMAARAYQMEMLQASMKQNIIVAVSCFFFLLLNIM